MLKKRVITALWTVPVLLAAVWFNRPMPWFTIFVAIWGLLAVYEFYRLAAVTKVASLTWFGLVWTLLLILSPQVNHGAFTLPLLTSGIMLSTMLLVFRPQKEGAFASWVWMMSGMLYVGLLLGYLVSLRIDGGREWVYLAIFTSFGTDTAAFFVGSTIGRRRLAPRISPAKTWEGAIAGVVGSIAVCLMAVGFFHMPLSYGEAVILGLLVSVFGQLGGMVMSLFKRNVGVKDSGTVMPGHGGFLDRTDTIAFSGVIVYYFLTIVV